MTYKIIFVKKLSRRIAGCLLAALLAASTLTYAQTAAVNPVVPDIVNYNGALTDASGKPLTAISGVTFSLYKDSEGGAPLWMETQNIQPDGVWGDGNGGDEHSVSGIVGTTDNGFAGYFENNSSSGFVGLSVYADNGGSMPFSAINSANGTFCDMDAAGKSELQRQQERGGAH
jgi:hypothetical protein